ncbi:GyrI-like domain-containing protein [Zongyangia hominis]|uniref:GyrI-like domain-containing protein n=1 Tax=Zongyangia hominis TaxID=2763677 RepID=A0A926EC42_9FIRM|nr:GyrI-like domain-containing protein [Zongyangia hominis]MBC8570338.1 GyrI-like domain-containing protein [Zongyangia hominis]
MGEKIDYKKRDKELYQPPCHPVLINVPPMNFIMVDGEGAPEGENYQQAIQALYSLSFTIKMSKLGSRPPAGYFDYAVPPLEGLWCGGESHNFLALPREKWRWTSLIRQPEFVTPEIFEEAVASCRSKKPGIPVERARFATFNEGLCVQMMHVGPYSEEEATIERIHAFIAKEGLVDMTGSDRRHHEIYLSNPERSSHPERLKTVLRIPVARP